MSLIGDTTVPMFPAHAYVGGHDAGDHPAGPQANPVYRDNVPGGGAVRLHHLGHRVPDVEAWEALIANIGREG